MEHKHMTTFPIEITRLIGEYLDLTSLGRLRIASKHFFHRLTELWDKKMLASLTVRQIGATPFSTQLTMAYGADFTLGNPERSVSHSNLFVPLGMCQKDLKKACPTFANITFALYNSGVLIVHGAQIMPHPDKIVDVWTGAEHAIVLDEHGRVFTYGRNHYGQLGTGNYFAYSTMFQARYQDKPVVAKAIAAGDYHSLILTQDGDVLGAGSNQDGQLAFNGAKALPSFEKIPFFFKGDVTALQQMISERSDELLKTPTKRVRQ